MASYTSHVFGTRALAWGTENLDNFLIGRYLGAAPLGVYTIAFSLMVTPVRRIAVPVTQVFFPAFSLMREPQKIAEAWLRGIRMVALVVVPVMAGMTVVAPDLVDVVFGEEWHAAGPLIQILASVGLIQALSALNFGILQSLARTRTLFRFSVVLSVCTVGGFAIGLSWSLTGAAWAYLIVSVALYPVFLWLTTRAVGLTPWDWLRSVIGVLAAGVAMAGVVLGARELLIETDLAVVLRLTALIGLGAAVYVLLVAWWAPEVRAELRGLRERQAA